jgi:diguanylate cyclase
MTLPLLFLLLGAALGGVTGMLVGWLARGREEVVVEKVVTKTVEKVVERAPAEFAKKHDEAREVLTQLHELTADVSAQINAHSRTVGDISEELTAATAGQAESPVLAAIRRLVASNTAMQSQLSDAQQQLEQQASLLQVHQQEARTDPLTKLANRRAFDDEISQRMLAAAATGSDLSLMMLDVDHFKKCNDTFGHLAGDEVLRMVGRVLSEGSAQQSGVFAARFGGEEFALLFAGADLIDAAKLGESLRRRIGSSPVGFEGQSLSVTASAGLTSLRGEDSAAAFISRADDALYAAKREGRNCACLNDDAGIHKFDPSSSHQPLPTAKTELESGEALERSLTRRIAEWRRGGTRLAMIVARIDNLSAVESSRGPRGRDQLIEQVGTHLKLALREMDQVATIAGDIFGMLLPSSRLADAARIADRMRSSVEETRFPDAPDLQLTLSLGVAEVMADDDGDALLLRARRAMESARRRGGNAVYINDGVYSMAATEVLDIAALSAP